MRFIPRRRRKEKRKDDEQLALDHAFEVRMNELKVKVGAIHEEDPQSGVMFISHLPHGFYKIQMLKFFSQFGRIKRIRMSTSKRTGRSRGFAYIEFEFAEVANIAAETMNNHLMFYKMLKCTVIPKEKLHSETFKNCYKKFKKPLIKDISRKRHNSLVKADPQRIRKSIERLTTGERKNQRKLEAMGIDYKIQGYVEQWEEAKSKAAEIIAASASTASASSEEEIINDKEEAMVDVNSEKSAKEKKPKSPKKKKRSIEKVAMDISTDQQISLSGNEDIITNNNSGDMILEEEKKTRSVGRRTQESRRKKMETPKKMDKENNEDGVAKLIFTRSKTLTKNDENLVTPKAPSKRSKMSTVTPAKRQRSATPLLSKSTGRKKSTKSKV